MAAKEAGANGRKLGIADEEIGLREVELDLVDVAPAPGLSWFDGLHDGMLGMTEVLGGMFVFGGVTTTNVAAFHTQPKVDPGVAHLETLFATFGVGLDRAYLIAVRAVGHVCSFL